MAERDVFTVELLKRGVPNGATPAAAITAAGGLVLPATPAEITGVQTAGPVKDLLAALDALGLITDSTTTE